MFVFPLLKVSMSFGSSVNHPWGIKRWGAWSPKPQFFTVFFIASCIRHDFYKIRGCGQFLSLLFDFHLRLPIDCLLLRFSHDTVLVWDNHKHHHKHPLTAVAVSETVTGHHNRGHDMMFYGQIEFKKWHDMAGDTSRSETCQGGSGRPRGGCIRGRRRVREHIAPVMKTGTNRPVRRCHLLWFYGSL